MVTSVILQNGGLETTSVINANETSGWMKKLPKRKTEEFSYIRIE